MRAIIAFTSLFTFLSFQTAFAGVDKNVNVREVQMLLAELCYDPGPIDGLWGKKTEKAVIEFFYDRKKRYIPPFDKKELLSIRMRKNRSTFNGAKICKISERNENKKALVDTSKDVVIFANSCCEIPDGIEWQPNDATLGYYYEKTANLRFKTDQMFMVGASSKPLNFKKALENHQVIDQEMAESTILSYLYYEDDVVVYDALPPKGRFSIDFNNFSYFPSHSMGKSITSYLVGHAICQGYFPSVDAPITDWPLMENTLYYGQPLIKLLNMQAGDTHVIRSGDGAFIKTRRNIHGNAPLLSAVKNPKELKNTKPKKAATFAYSNLTADVIFNFIMHRVGGDFEHFISNFYRNKVKIEHPVFLWMNPLTDRSNNPSINDRIKQGAGQYGITATRYDFLRIAIAIMDDWQNDTCEGKYLKEIYKRRVHKGKRTDRWDSNDRRFGKIDFNRQTKRYAGQFHSEVVGLEGRQILVMNGANGQQIVIDMDNSRIIAIGAVKEKHYDTFKLGFEPIKYGRIR